jgi:hypothetical protein
VTQPSGSDALTDVVARSAALVPLLRENAGATEKARRLALGTSKRSPRQASSSSRCPAASEDTSGATSLQQDAPIQRPARDAQAISLHSLLLPSMNIELLGRTLFGLEPNSFPL